MGRSRTLSQIQFIAIHHTADHGTVQQLLAERARRNEGYNFIIRDDEHPNNRKFKAVQDAPDNEISNGTYGANTQTWNVSVVGNFEIEKPTDDELFALVQVIAAKARSWGWRKRDVAKITYHQYIGLYLAAPGYRYGTACPGKNLIARIPEIRQRVAAYLPG
jgi:hypothetical protein